MKNKVLTLILAVSLPLVMMAYESPITEPGADNPTDMYTTTNPNHASGGPNRATQWEGNSGSDPGSSDPGSPVGAPWILLGFAVAYAAYRLVRRKGVKD